MSLIPNTDYSSASAPGVVTPLGITTVPEFGLNVTFRLSAGAATVNLLGDGAIVKTVTLPLSGARTGMSETLQLLGTYSTWSWSITSISGGGTVYCTADGIEGEDPIFASSLKGFRLLPAATASAAQALASGSIPVIDVTRNSLNDATDLDEVTLATMVVPGGVLKLGSVVEIWGLFENTNSALTKTLSARVDGTAVANVTNTTNQSYGIRYPLNVHDANTLIYLLNGASPGAGSASGVFGQKVIANVIDVGFTITLTAKWSAAALGEFIRLKHGKFKIIY